MDKPKQETDKQRVERERVEYGVLGDIEVPPDEKGPKDKNEEGVPFHEDEGEAGEPMDGGSQHGESHHPGSREMTEGTTGGAGTEVGGTRNYRQGTGFTSGDIGNRPE